jgi:hypothetical protein
MPRKQLQVLVTAAEFAKLANPADLRAPHRNLLVELGHPAEEVEGVVVTDIIRKPEIGGVVLLVEHDEYDTLPDFTEAPVVKIKDPKLTRPSKRKKATP